MLLALWFLWFIGEGLERAWGPFRLTLYFVVGMIGTTIAAFFFGGNFSNGMLYASLFFAFARFYPDEVIYILFILPVKIKWLAWISAAFLMLGFVIGTEFLSRGARCRPRQLFHLSSDQRLFIKRGIARDVSARRKRFAPSSRAAPRRSIAAQSVARPS